MRWRTLVALGLTAGLVGTGGLAAQDTRPGIAVLPFENGGSYGQDAENFEALTIGLQQMLITEFASNAQLRVVERGRLRELLAEQDLGASGRVDANTAARLGRLVGARYVVLGGFIDFWGDFRIDIRIVNVETGEVVRTERVRNKREELYNLVVESATKVTRGLNLPALPRQVQSQRESRQVPTEAVTLYTRGLLFADRGDNARATELFSQAIAQFPEYTEAQEALRQLRQS